MVNGNEKEFQKDFGRYLLMEKLGRGGMGAVYKAWDRNLNRVVAVKLLLGEPEEESENPSTDQAETAAEEIRRFHREAQTAAKLHHPNIVQIYDVGIYNGKHYFAMEYIHGLSLRNIIRDLHKIEADDIVLRPALHDMRAHPDNVPKLPFRRLLLLLREIGYGLHYAHQHNIIHRDVKPENILVALTEDEEGEFQIGDLFTDKEFVCKIADFGLVRDISSDSKLTMSGQLLGTPGYMSPEQARGESAGLGSVTDTFSLGIVMYEIFTGRNPFQGKTIYHIMKYVLERDPVRPRKINRHLHPDLETIILKALEKDTARRYSSTKEFSDDINRFLHHEPIHARPPSNFYRTKRFLARHKEVAFTLAAFLMVISIGVLYFFYKAGQIRKSVEHAQYVREGQRKSAQTYLAAAQEYVDVAIEARNNGDPELIMEKLEPARKLIWNSIREDPLFADAYCLLGYTDMLQNNSELAIQNLDKAIRCDKDHVLAHYYRGQLYFAGYAVGFDELNSDEAVLKSSRDLSGEREQLLKKIERLKNDALADFSSIRRNRLGSARSAYCNGIIAYLKNVPEAAIAELQKAVDIDPYYSEALLVLGVLYNANGQTATAIECFSRVIDNNKSDILAYYNRANLYAGKDMIEEAFADYRKIEKFNPGNYPIVFLRIGELFLSKGDTLQALEYFTRAVEKCSGFSKVKAYLLRGNIYLARLKYSEALADFNAAQKVMPEYHTVYLCRGLAHYALGEYELAVVDYDNAVELAPYSVEAYINRGNAYNALKKHAMAREDYTYALGLNPYSAMAHYNLGVLLKELGEYGDALKHLSASLEIDPDYVDALLERAALYLQLERYDYAIADCKKIIYLNPETEDAYFFSGYALYRQDRFAEAVDLLDKALELNPVRDASYLYRGKAYFGANDSRNALEDYSAAIGLNPAYTEAYYDRAIVYFYLNEFAEALKDLDNAVKLDDKYTDAVFLRGAVNARLNMPEAAYRDYKKALELNPNHPYAAEMIKFINEIERK